jgi:DnaJ-class molecular chaperone
MICPKCEGEGSIVRRMTWRGQQYSTDWEICHDCKGTGQVPDEKDADLD